MIQNFDEGQKEHGYIAFSCVDKMLDFEWCCLFRSVDPEKAIGDVKKDMLIRMKDVTVGQITVMQEERVKRQGEKLELLGRLFEAEKAKEEAETKMNQKIE